MAHSASTERTKEGSSSGVAEYQSFFCKEDVYGDFPLLHVIRQVSCRWIDLHGGDADGGDGGNGGGGGGGADVVELPGRGRRYGTRGAIFKQ